MQHVSTMSELRGRAALVTGGASGIGRACVQLLVAQGASVWVGDVDDVAGKRLADEITAAGGACQFVHTDVADPVQCSALVDAVIDRAGRVDIAFNNAGIMNAQPCLTADTSLDAWHRILDINLNGVFHCMRAELIAMRAHGGSIVNTASIAGQRGIFGSAAYCASKHGVIGLSRAAALEYGRFGIRVNVVCPGYIDTPLVVGERATVPSEWLDKAVRALPVRRMGSAEEIARMVAWLLSDQASYVTGACFTADGGLTAG